MNTNEQQAQRDKLIELVGECSDSNYEYGYAIGFMAMPDATKERMLKAEKAFRDYVEHMHDEPRNLSAIRCVKCSWIDYTLYKQCEDCRRRYEQRMK